VKKLAALVQLFSPVALSVAGHLPLVEKGKITKEGWRVTLGNLQLSIQE